MTSKQYIKYLKIVNDLDLNNQGLKSDATYSQISSVFEDAKIYMNMLKNLHEHDNIVRSIELYDEEIKQIVSYNLTRNSFKNIKEVFIFYYLANIGFCTRQQIKVFVSN